MVYKYWRVLFTADPVMYLSIGPRPIRSFPCSAIFVFPRKAGRLNTNGNTEFPNYGKRQYNIVMYLVHVTTAEHAYICQYNRLLNNQNKCN